MEIFMDISRRSFLRGSLTVAAIAVIQPTIALADVPTIYGDGIHDDASGLQALIDDQPFRVDGSVVQASRGVIRGGEFAIGKTLNIRHGNILIDHCHFVSLPGFEGAEMIYINQSDGVHCITNCVFNSRHVSAQSSIYNHILFS
jgi:hypothetical protein